MNKNFRAAFWMLLLPAFAAAPGLAQSVYTPFTFTTLAGNAGYGSVDGTGSVARFNNPVGVAADSSGNLYVADSSNQTIRKVAPGGIVTTLAGLAGNGGRSDGTGQNARFAGPQGVTVDNAGNIYVADLYGNSIRKITSAGEVTTLAGHGVGDRDGIGTNAGFSNPQGVAVDNWGNVYVTEPSTIRQVTPNGVVTTLAGLAGIQGSSDGIGSAARFYDLQGVVVDGLGNLYVADTEDETIRKVTPVGTNWVVTTLAGKAGVPGSVNGTGTAARFNGPWGLALDTSGNLYATCSDDTIRKITTTNTLVTTVAGLAQRSNLSEWVGGSTDGLGNVARFSQPTGVTVDNAGNLYVADSANNTIRELAASGNDWIVSTIAGLAGSAGTTDASGAFARFDHPVGVALDGAGNMYISEQLTNTIRVVTRAGAVITLAGLAGKVGSADGPGSVARFNQPSGVAVDGAGNVYVADTGNHTIRQLTLVGSAWVVTTIAGLAGNQGFADGAGSVARFVYPTGLTVDSAGNLYVADQSSDLIRKMTLTGTNWMVTTLAGSPGSPGTGDGPGSRARFSGPQGMAADEAGNLYVADTDNNSIRKMILVGTNWMVTTLAGLSAQYGGSQDGLGNAATFNRPVGLAVDRAANVYVVDTGNHLIRKITPGGVVTTLAGLVLTVGVADGTGSVARFNFPSGVAVDSGNFLYVTDTDNRTIRKGYRVAPSIFSAGPGFGFNNGQFGFLLTGPNGENVVVQSSTDLATWIPVWTNTFSGPLFFSDPTGVFSNRFYRLLLP